MILPDFNFEKSFLPPQGRYLLGIDEVGRGCWAGPLCLAGFLLDSQTFNYFQFTDSKQLTASKRSHISAHLTANYPYFIVTVSPQDIDNNGLSASLKSAILQIQQHFQDQYQVCLYDGNCSYGLNLKTIIKGDSHCFSIAAASIIAKHYRDSLMINYSQEYPLYGFDHHVGYGTKQHLSALQKYGPCPIHRLSFRPIQKILHSILPK
ncbi:MAG TPA: ribonuclease HII [Candidatus Woesebacteria bacterium]|mgnify:CR=1 FL=1|nr:ribonuclease HII [Candidatus Woesebacteria bacterium]